ncbi:conserved hypothetical protein [Ricinus communis]|uniref:Uncharacterized protein n=1 Tax=Ricinus communis TaxID=3988 RepID=B9SDX4_RICCO|nr:conserved hypothetical protein [Ricinus communis]
MAVKTTFIIISLLACDKMGFQMFLTPLIGRHGKNTLDGLSQAKVTSLAKEDTEF